MGGAGFPLATQKAGGGGAVETDEPAPLGGVHRLQGSSYRLLEHSACHLPCRAVRQQSRHRHSPCRCRGQSRPCRARPPAISSSGRYRSTCYRAEVRATGASLLLLGICFWGEGRWKSRPDRPACRSLPDLRSLGLGGGEDWRAGKWELFPGSRSAPSRRTDLLPQARSVSRKETTKNEYHQAYCVSCAFLRRQKIL